MFVVCLWEGLVGCCEGGSRKVGVGQGGGWWMLVGCVEV